ncbi:uncharacterized protein LOC135817282 [Sycon ciliatum]|uniref:uncharacterized protein LOC135817282 n=1 Tax=Sycon ciliatum TaxID=27933 RepID=UPI0031F6D6C2
MLKVIDAQTFVCTDSSALKNLCAQLEKLSEELAKSLPTDESGLVIQEASSFTLNQHFSARRRLHETYSTAVPDPALESGHAKRGRPAVERHLRCRVGVSGETERRQFLQAQQREKASTRPGSVTLTALTGSSSIQQAAAPEPARLLHSAGATLYPMPATSVPVFATDGLQQRTRCNTGPQQPKCCNPSCAFPQLPTKPCRNNNCSHVFHHVCSTHDMGTYCRHCRVNDW